MPTTPAHRAADDWPPPFVPPPSAPPPFVSVAWLRAALADAARDVVICDVRTTMAGGVPADDHAAGHLPGAVLIDLDADLAAPPDGIHGRHPLPSPEHLAVALGRAGVGADDVVVAYDAGIGGIAARLVWMLRIIGQPAALLDGGLAAWDGELETGPVERPAVERPVVAWPTAALADADAVAALTGRGGVVIDSRDPARYRGDHEPLDPVAGHVPGAINLPFADNVAAAPERPATTDSSRSTGSTAGTRLRSRDELVERFAPLAGGRDAIVYCGSGVTACHNALAAEYAGYHRPRVYVGSWSGWCADPDRAVATGD